MGQALKTKRCRRCGTSQNVDDYPLFTSIEHACRGCAEILGWRRPSLDNAVKEAIRALEQIPALRGPASSEKLQGFDEGLLYAAAILRHSLQLAQSPAEEIRDSQMATPTCP